MFTSETRAVAMAESALEVASDRLGKAAAAVENADRRLADLDQRRGEIVGRRAGGQYHPGDGGELEAIGADTEGLVSIRSALAGAHAVALQAHVAATARAHGANFALQRAKDGVLETKLASHADQLFALLGETLTHLGAVGKRTGRGQLWWRPDPVIALTIHKADLQRVGVR
ncbi:MAG: hypothetical protein WCJ64_21945 [Rhodospirillaceae bacterium]